LPGIGATGLGGAGAGQSAEIAFTVIACPHPTVRIARIMIADRNWWALIGTAEIADFVYYKTELSPDGAGWTLLYRSDTPVADGTLMKFNIRTVPRGTYQLRLVAVDRTGNYPAPCTIQITTR
jgi:hypothetical protein